MDVCAIKVYGRKGSSSFLFPPKIQRPPRVDKQGGRTGNNIISLVFLSIFVIESPSLRPNKQFPPFLSPPPRKKALGLNCASFLNTRGAKAN